MTWTINGTDPRTLGLVVDQLGGWRTMPGKRRTVGILPGVPGARPLDAQPQEQPKRFSITGVVRGTSVTDAQNKLDLLIALFSSSSLAIIFNDTPTRQVTCEVEDIQVSMTGPAIISRDIPITIGLVAYDPFSYDTSTTSVNGLLGTGTGTAIPLGTGPVRASISITCTGAPTNNPILTLFNSAGVSIGTMGFTVSMIVTDAIIVDCALKTIKFNTVLHPELLTSGDFFVLDVTRQGVYSTSSWPSILRSTNMAVNVTYKKAWRD